MSVKQLKLAGLEVFHRKILGFHIVFAWRRTNPKEDLNIRVIYTICSLKDQFSREQAYHILWERYTCLQQIGLGGVDLFFDVDIGHPHRSDFHTTITAYSDERRAKRYRQELKYVRSAIVYAFLTRGITNDVHVPQKLSDRIREVSLEPILKCLKRRAKHTETS